MMADADAQGNASVSPASADRYIVDAILKENDRERTERVHDAAGKSYIRKRLAKGNGFGEQYRAVQQLNAPSLPRIYDVHDEGDGLVVVMEYLEGFTLREWVRQYGPLSESEARTVMLNLCEGVAALHSCNPPIIHRDITPGNVILSKRGALLIDFGIARRYNEANDHDTETWGTVGYAAPEQFGFGQSDGRTDIFALGMLYYYVLTGKDPQPTLFKNIAGQSELPAPQRNLIAACIALDPKDRFDSVDALKQALLWNAAPKESPLSPPDPQSAPLPFPAPDAASANYAVLSLAEPLAAPAGPPIAEPLAAPLSPPIVPPSPAPTPQPSTTPTNTTASHGGKARKSPKDSLMTGWRIFASGLMVLLFLGLLSSSFTSWRADFPADHLWYLLYSLDIYGLLFVPLYLVSTDIKGCISKNRFFARRKVLKIIVIICGCFLLAVFFSTLIQPQFSADYLAAAAQNGSKI